MKVMRPQPFNAQTSIWVGWVEEDKVGRRVIITTKDGQVTRVSPTDFDFDFELTPNQRSRFELLDGEAEFHGPPRFRHGAAFDCILADDVLYVHHLMALEALELGIDCDPMCLNLHLLNQVMPDLDVHLDVARMPITLIATHAGVIDPVKIELLCRVRGWRGVIMKNNYGCWNLNPPPSSIDGKSGPAWTRWRMPQ